MMKPAVQTLKFKYVGTNTTLLVAGIAAAEAEEWTYFYLCNNFNQLSRQNEQWFVASIGLEVLILRGFDLFGASFVRDQVIMKAWANCLVVSSVPCNEILG